VETSKKTELLLHILKQEDVRTALVFSRTKFGADRIAGQLTRAGLTVEVMHSDRNMAQRVRALEAFRNGDVKVLIATDVAQRGIDVEGISHVINYDAPRDPEGYVHRVGRTARAGETGVAITFMSGGEIGDVAAVEQLLGARIPRVNVPGYSFFVADTPLVLGEDGEPAPPVEQAAMPLTKRAAQKEARSSRGRKVGELSQEELAKLLKVV
jgi:ATP-dependent RNA helicase RhlE